MARAAGIEATHVNHLGLSGRPDWALAERIVKDELTLVTNNRLDFLKLFGGLDLHSGLMIIVPNVTPSLQRALFDAALRYSRGKDLVNSVIEVSLEGKPVHCVEYRWPTD